MSKSQLADAAGVSRKTFSEWLVPFREDLRRMHVKDTDIGIELQSQIEDLKELLDAYRSGDLKERNLRPITNKR